MKKFSSRKGFTLVELLIVITVIGILATVLFPQLTGFIGGARDSARVGALRNIATALAQYQKDYEQFYVPQNKSTACFNELKAELNKYSKNLTAESNTKIGISTNEGGIDCVSKGGYGYKLLATETLWKEAWSAYALAARLEGKSEANLTAGQFKSATNTNTTGNTNIYTSIEANKKTKPNYTTGNDAPVYAVVN